MSDNISRIWREIKPYAVKAQDNAITRRGAPAPAVATPTVGYEAGVWNLDDGSNLDDGLFLDPS